MKPKALSGFLLGFDSFGMSGQYNEINNKSIVRHLPGRSQDVQTHWSLDKDSDIVETNYRPTRHE